jgi:NAD+---dinitrogen-reductase ADP-D-ribosyltransferase
MWRPAGEGRATGQGPVDVLAEPDRWYTTNLTGVPASIIGSTAFNERPHELAIHGTREAHANLFRMLDVCGTQTEAGEVFARYMDIVFGLQRGERGIVDGPHRFRASYLKLLQGWGFDANSPQGAVIKGWAESRFGLVPRFHKAPLGRFPSPAWTDYVMEKMGSRFHNNCINMQLDALYEYCQWSIRRFALVGPGLVRLWRGTNHCDEQIVAGSLRERVCVMQLNNVVSFSLSPERAEEFGDWTLEALVPSCKLLFFPGLLNDRVLNSEGEALVLGGLYRVKVRYG